MLVEQVTLVKLKFECVLQIHYLSQVPSMLILPGRHILSGAVRTVTVYRVTITRLCRISLRFRT